MVILRAGYDKKSLAVIATIVAIGTASGVVWRDYVSLTWADFDPLLVFCWLLMVALAAWQGSTPRYAGATLYAPLTWRAAEVLLLNVNIGWDWVRGVPSRGRAGISLEWQASPEWTVIVERYGQYGAEVARAGLRWQPSDVLAVDLSRARGLGSRSGGSWALGATWTFDAPGAGRRAR